MIYVTASEMREIDRRAIEDIGIPGVVLMAAAGKTVADVVLDMAPPKAVVAILCGKGNNGGDGFVVARLLAEARLDVRVCLAGKTGEIKGDAFTFHSVYVNLRGDVYEFESNKSRLTADLAKSDLIVDALLGTGLSGEVRGAFRTLIEDINGASKPVVAVDIPSGLHADTGVALGAAVRAKKTVTFQYPKVGFREAAATEFIGELIIADIGIPGVCGK